jgi:RHS repeat-associated protein
MTYPNGIATSYTYDNLNRLTRLKADLGAIPVTDFQYVYDNAGNRTRKQQLDYTEDYAYDPLYRLTGVTRSAGGTGLWQGGYDPVGNRTSAQIGTTVSTSTYNEKNQLTSSTGGGPLRWRGTLNEPGSVAFTSALVNGKPAKMLQGNVFEATLDMVSGSNTVTVQATDVSGNVTTKNYQVSVTGSGATYSYDPNGSLATKAEGSDTWGYEWNALNELTRVTKNSVEQARFAYDPLGRRVEKVAGGVTTSYAYDNEDILREVRGAATLKYVHGPGIDDAVAVDDGTALSYFHADGLGSIVGTTSTAGTVTLTRQYDAWGNLETGGGEPGYAFTGREWDPETGLYAYRARYYDPEMGQFISEDPMGLAGGINAYGYADGSPTTWTDPMGAVKVRWKLKTRYMDDVSTVCRTSSDTSYYGCIQRWSADVAWKCKGKCGAYRAETVATIGSDIFVYKGPYPYKPLVLPADPTVTDPKSAYAHEFRHLYEGLTAMMPILNELESKTFLTKPECEAAAAAAASTAEATFYDTLHRSPDYRQ